MILYGGVLLIFAGFFDAVYSDSFPEHDKSVDKVLPIEELLNETDHIQKIRVSNAFSSSTPRITKYRIRTSRIMFARPYEVDNETELCLQSSDDFPNVFTEEQRKNGAIVLAFFLGIYCFTILAIICDNYFLPCMERICETLNLSRDVAAATFMSVATSAPELFVNIIGTFVTESDIGIGTVVGSSMFNTLGVASLGGLAAVKPLQLDWWPVTRDVTIYILAIATLVIMTWDGYIYWYEGLVLFVAYFIYFTIMFLNPRISKFAKGLVEKYTNKEKDVEKANNNNNINNNNNSSNFTIAIISNDYLMFEEPLKKYVEPKVEEKSKKEKPKKERTKEEEETKIDGDTDSLWNRPLGNWYKKAFFFYTWPIRFMLRYSIPNTKVYPKLFPITFIMCIIWIGTNSYLVSWMITIIGSVFRIPDAVLGLTFLAAGGCLPEAISIIIMSRKGEGSMGVSNSLGANTMNILLSLGMPWFIKTAIMGADNNSYIRINSGSIEYTILALILVALALYLVLFLSKFRLSKKVGVVLMSVYTVFIVLAIVSELIFYGTDSECKE